METEILSKLISESAKVFFSESREKFGKNNIIGYSILSHDTADSCGPVVATKYGLDAFEYGSNNDFLFSPVEWDEFDNGPSFNEVNDEIGKLYDVGDYDIDPDWHEKFRELVFEANVKSLEALINEGYFGTEVERNKLFIIFCLSDSETFVTHEPKWVKRLNTTAVNKSNEKWRNILLQKSLL